MTRTSSSLHLTAPRSHGLRDLAVVAFLAIVLGSFVAQIASAPSSARTAPVPTAAACVAPAARS
jgi:hypothetical protein